MRTRLVITTLAAFLGGLLIANVASAHVTVWPRESAAGTSDIYTVRVPSEKDVPTTQVRVEFPPEVTVSRFVPAPGWQREVEKDSIGRIVAATWSGGSIASDEVGFFGISGRNATTEGPIAWKAYQTYADGSVVEWNGPAGSEQPASVAQLTAAPMSAVALTQSLAAGQAMAAIALLDASGFHELHEQLEAGAIPPGSLGKIQRARLVTAATQWPEALGADAKALVGHLGHLQEALEGGDPAAAAGPAAEVHETEHDLSQAVYGWLGERSGLAEAGAGH